MESAIVSITNLGHGTISTYFFSPPGSISTLTSVTTPSCCAFRPALTASTSSSAVRTKYPRPPQASAIFSYRTSGNNAVGGSFVSGSEAYCSAFRPL